MVNTQELNADLIIIGASTGGCTTAMSALKMGKKVILTEETKWIGGQLTSQGVPPDEHPWIEMFGATASYTSFRRKIRDYYKSTLPVKSNVRENHFFNPGNALVSNISHDPRVSLKILYDMFSPYLYNGQLTLLLEYKPIKADTENNKIVSITVVNQCTTKELELVGKYFIDGTELGDVLPLVGAEYVTGAESQEDTEEPNAVVGKAEPTNMQAFTFCFAMDYIEGENHTIEQPEQYDYWREYQADFWPNRQLSWWGLVPHTLEPIEYSLFPEKDKFSLWKYRRILDKSNFEEGFFESDITLVNWPQNDYWMGSIIDVSEEEKERHLFNAKQLSLSLLYWMQTEAPRHDGGFGYPGLRLRKDVMGTEDGLAMYPYIRESRRIKALYTVREQDISGDLESNLKAIEYYDSVGIGCYRIDLHPSTGLNTYIDVSAFPFQIPLGSLIPIRLENLLPASKNIGTTHVTNGCFRLHPVEWNIGEVVGYLASYCIDNQLKPHSILAKKEYLVDFQLLLMQKGINLEWPLIHKV